MKLELTPAQAQWLRVMLGSQRDEANDKLREHGHRYYCDPEMARALRFNKETSEAILHQLNEAEVETPPAGAFR